MTWSQMTRYSVYIYIYIYILFSASALDHMILETYDLIVAEDGIAGHHAGLWSGAPGKHERRSQVSNNSTNDTATQNEMDG